MEYSAKIDMGDYQLFFQTFGSGEPTVVFESGGECGADSLAGLAKQVQSFTRALIYDRAGLGRSDPAPRPRMIQDAVNDLHTLLHTAPIRGPYLLVGHSFGGLILRLYTAQYPQEVAGLVLLDVPHPEQSLREMRLLPPASSQEPAALTTFRNEITAEWTDPFHNREVFDKAASAAQVVNSGPFGNLPLVVVTAGIDEWEDGFPPEIASRLADDWMEMQRELAGLSDSGTHLIAAESTHAIQDCQPELVVEVIRKLVETLRS